MWPISHAAALLALRPASPPATRPIPLSDGGSGPSWGPLTWDGIVGMHWGDLFYAALGLAVWYFSWPVRCHPPAPALANLLGEPPPWRQPV